MKISNTASAVRATFTPTEVADLQFVIDAAQRAGHYMPARVPEIIAALAKSADDVRMTRAIKRAEKDRIKRDDEERRARERYFMIGDDYSVTANLSDYADLTNDPDQRQWTDLFFHAAMNRTMPDQCEIRRNVWLVRVIRLDCGSMSAIVGSNCTEGASADEIAPLAEQLIAAFESRPTYQSSTSAWSL